MNNTRTPGKHVDAAELQALILSSGLPDLPPDLVTAVANKEGEQFRQALRTAAANPAAEGPHRSYLASVITACMPATRKVVASLGFPTIRISQLIDISKTEGGVFKNAVRALAREGITGETASMHQYLIRTLHAICPQEETPTGPPDSNSLPSEDPTPAAQADAVPPANVQTSSTVTPMNRQLSTSKASEQNRTSKFDSTHLYGGKAAYCFSTDETRKPAATLRVEAAKAIATRQYDWKNKTSFQLTESELPLVFGVLYGFIPRVELLGHGAENEKSLLIEEQGDKFFFSMRVRGGDTYAMPAPAKDAFPIMAMLLSQMQKNAPTLPITEIKHLARRVCEMYSTQVKSLRQAANG